MFKYADDTVLLGLINNKDESGYRRSVHYFAQWCIDNRLKINVGKTK